MDTAFHVNCGEEEVGRCRLQIMPSTVGPMYLLVHWGGLKSASSPFCCCSISRQILLMSSEGNATEHCKLKFCAVSAVLVINDELSVGPGRAISIAISYIAAESKAQCYPSFHLQRQMQVTLRKAASEPQISSSWLLWDPRAAPQEEPVCHTYAQHLIIVALPLLILSDPVGYFPWDTAYRFPSSLPLSSYADKSWEKLLLCSEC